MYGQLESNLSVFLKAASAFLCIVGFMALACLWNILGSVRKKGRSEESAPLLLRLVFGVSRPFDRLVGGMLVKFPCLDGISAVYSRSILLAGLEKHLKVSLIYTAQVVWLVLGALLCWNVGSWCDAEFESSYMECLGVVLGCVFGLLSPWAIVDGIAERRQAVITRSMPFAIDLMTSAMRGGMDFWAALKYYLEIQSVGPLEREFDILLKEREHNLAEETALRNFAHRVGSMAALSFAGAVIHAHKVGAPLGKTLEMFGEEMRRERFEQAEQQGGKLSTLILFPCILCILPSSLCFFGGAILMKLQASGVFGQ